MPFFFYDSTWFLLLPAIILSVWAQVKVKSTFSKYDKIQSGSGMNGAALAQRLLNDFGLHPRSKTLRLSTAVAQSRSVAALGVAAHEVGHAVQHQEAYQPFQIRQAIAPVAGFGSQLAFPLIFAGLFFSVRLFSFNWSHCQSNSMRAGGLYLFSGTAVTSHRLKLEMQVKCSTQPH